MSYDTEAEKTGKQRSGAFSELYPVDIGESTDAVKDHDIVIQ